MPVQNPALKIPPIRSQPETVTESSSRMKRRETPEREINM
jgi:hypothetical protein